MNEPISAWAPESILTLLKTETKTFHDAIESRVALKQRLRDVPSYAQLLGRFFGFHVPLENTLTRIIGYETVGLALQPRLKSGRLCADLAVLRVEAECLPMCTKLPEIRHLGDALGSLYVLEGSTLGGQFIRREVEKHLLLTAEHGCSYFSSYGAGVGRMWKSFQESLVRYATTPEAATTLVQAACETFQKLNDWFAEERLP